MSSSSTRPRAWLRRRTVPLLAAVVVAVALLSTLRIPIAADARMLRYHRKHHRHHRAANTEHIALPPAALPPNGDPRAVEDALPPPRARNDKPCPMSRPPSKAPAGAPRPEPAPAELLAFSLPKWPSPAPAKAPSRSRANLPAEPPTVPRIRPPSLPPAKPPSSAPASTPAHSPRKAHAPSFSPCNPPSLPPLHANPPPSTRAESPPPSVPPRLAPVRPPMPAWSPRLSPASPPAVQTPGKPPKTAPTQPPQLSPAKPQQPVSSTVKPPQLAPAKSPMPSRTPVNPPGVPPASAPQPALPPAISKAPALPPPAPVAKNGSCGNVFDVRAFGASGNGSCDDDTRAFRTAWKAACSSDSAAATLLVPSDGVFTITSTIFAGPCKAELTFQIDGVLMPPDGPANWPASDSPKQWIVFYKADGMTLAGKGTIEGNGEAWWDLPCKPHRGPNGSTLPGPCDSPALFRFFLSNDVTVRGLRIENSPKFHVKFDDCQRVRVDGLFVSSPAFSPNTDGIHVENTTSVQILNSRIYNGDDCVSIGAGCSGVHIENVTCGHGHGHGISIGSLGVRNTRACVSNVTVRNTRIIDSDNGVRIKTWQGGAGAVSAVEFSGVRMQNVKNCIVIDQYYCLGSSGCANQSSAVRVAGVAYRDIRGTYNPRGGAPIRLACSDAVACTDITMSGVQLLPANGSAGTRMQLADPFCWNAYGLVETPTLPPVFCLQEGRPESLQDQLTSC